MVRASLKIGGMSCGHCTRVVAGALRELDGVEVERVEIGSVTVRYDPGRVTSGRIRAAMEDEGYTVPEERILS